MAALSHIVTLFDCDNTLLDHDHVMEDLRNHLEQEFGPRNRDRYFDDKLRILAEMKKVWGDRLTTIFHARAITRWTPTTLLSTRSPT
jgi:FMN phosphatase YigB (HAD superfamily)